MQRDAYERFRADVGLTVLEVKEWKERRQKWEREVAAG